MKLIELATQATAMPILRAFSIEMSITCADPIAPSPPSPSSKLTEGPSWITRISGSGWIPRSLYQRISVWFR